MRTTIDAGAGERIESPRCATELVVEHPLSRRAMLGALATIAGAGALSTVGASRLWAAPLEMRRRHAPVLAYVYSTPHLGCCDRWCAHLEHNGFEVTSATFDDLTLFKRQFAVPQRLWSCHTALVGNYVIEGHVPADLIERLRRDPRGIAGLAVPGMPCGAPGLEGPDPQHYDVIAFTKTGETFVYAKR